MIKDLQKKLQEEKDRIKANIKGGISQSLGVEEKDIYVDIKDDFQTVNVTLHTYTKGEGDKNTSLFSFKRYIAEDRVVQTISTKSYRTLYDQGLAFGVVPLETVLSADTISFVFMMIESNLINEPAESVEVPAVAAELKEDAEVK